MRTIHVRVIQWIVAVCAVIIILVMAGIIILQSALKDPGQHELPVLFAEVSGMNLNKEEQDDSSGLPSVSILRTIFLPLHF